MAFLSKILNLFRFNPKTDGSLFFNLDKAFGENFDKLENAISITNYNSEATYPKDYWVLGIVDGQKKLFTSLVDENKGNDLTDTNYWKELSLGGGMPIGKIYPMICEDGYIPDGSLPCDGTEYSAKQFSQFYQNFLKSGRLKTCSYLDYETEIGLFGQCGKFGVNTRITNICSNDNLIVGGNYNGDTSNIFTYKRNGDDELTISEYVSIDDSCTNNNGIVSNFANGGVTINNINSNEVKFIVFETSEDVITEQHIVSFSDLYSLRISNGLLQLIQYDSSDILISSCVVEPNTKYTLQIIGQTNFVIINGVTKKTSIDEYIFDYLTPINSSLVFGYGKNQSPFLGYLFLTLSTYASRISLTEADNDYATLIENGYWSDLNNNYNGSSIGLDEYGLSVIGTPNSGDTISFETQNFFRVPLIKDGTVIQQALTSDELGKAYNAGLPNIEGGFKASLLLNNGVTDATGAITSEKLSSSSKGDSGHNFYQHLYTLNASLSNSVYGNSDTVQMNAVALRYFVVVATGQVNESLMDWSEWNSSLTNKASKSDVDGKWVTKNVTLLDSLGTLSQVTIDLSDYLPNDGFDYEVKFKFVGYDNDSTYGYYLDTDLWITSETPIQSDEGISSPHFHIYGGTYARQTVNIIDLPVGINRFVKVTGLGADNVYLHALGYRRLGKNI